MSRFEAVRIALRALRVNLLRSVLTMLGIIIGVASVITMVAVGAGASARVQEQIASLGSNLIVIWPGSVTQAGVRLGGGTRPTLTEDDAVALQENIADVVAAAPQIRGNTQVVFGNTNWATGVVGVTPEFFVARDWQLTAGRAIGAEDQHGGAKVVVIGRTVANALFGDSDPVGETIRIRRVPFTVIGVLDRKGQNQWGQDQDDVLLVPLRTARSRVLGGWQGKLRTVGIISVRARDGADMAGVEEEIRALLRQRHGIPPGREDDFGMRNLSEILEAQEQSTRVLTYLLAAIASVSLVVGGIGIMNIMLVSVSERTREIGLRMAVGARRRDILAQFLIEAVTLSVIGGAVGIVLGVGAAHAVSELAGWRIELQIDAVVLAVAFAAAVGIFFGYYPARKASRLLPMQALRHE
jgi:putative ABC transport system permease protein